MSNELMKFEDTYLRDEILQRLKEGESPFSVATWVQQDLLEMTEIPTPHLARSIKQFYVSTVPVHDRMALSKNRSAIQRTVERQRMQTSALEEMITLYFLQKGRLNLAHQDELIVAELKEKIRNSENFEDELDNMLSEMNLEVDEKTKGKKKKNGKMDILAESSLNGTLDNTIETARRMLMDIHRMRQELDLQPRQVDKIEVESTSPDYEVKRSKFLHNVFGKLEKFTTDDGIEVELVEDE